MNRLLPLSILCFLFSVDLWSQDNNPEDWIYQDTINVADNFFDNPDPVYVTLKFDIKTFQKEKLKGEYQDAILSYKLNDSTNIEKNVRIKARGNFRRDHCAFPPIWLNIKKAKIENPSLQGVNKLKVVTHCKLSTSYEQYILKEFLAYKIYNLLSPYSFKVRLMRIEYIDTGRKHRKYERWGFLIDNEILLSESVNATPVKIDHLAMSMMDENAMDLMAIFQYMIGNSDWSIAGRHNVKIIKINDFSIQGAIPVPYDFDYSGLVNTYYAIPGDNLGILTVTERYYLGPCRTEEQFQSILEDLKSKETEIKQLVQDFEYLSPSSKNEVLQYINSFFVSAKSSGFIKRSLESTCRK